MEEECTCGGLEVELGVVTTQSWAFDCPTHGVGTKWYLTSDIRKDRQAENQRLRKKYQRRIEARKQWEKEHGIETLDDDPSMSTVFDYEVDG
jgi:hypothetical protein